jgi:hypothetical protein
MHLRRKLYIYIYIYIYIYTDLGVGFVYIQTIGFICIVWYLDKNFGGMFFGVERCWENGGC